MKNILLKGIAAFLRRTVAWLHERRELENLPASEVAIIAGDLGVSVSELRDNAATNGSWRQLLDKRLSQFGLDKAEMEKKLPNVMRDLERTCGRCGSEARCRKDLNLSRKDAVSNYCPNSHTLEALGPSIGAPK